MGEPVIRDFFWGGLSGISSSPNACCSGELLVTLVELRLHDAPALHPLAVARLGLTHALIAISLGAYGSEVSFYLPCPPKPQVVSPGLMVFSSGTSMTYAPFSARSSIQSPLSLFWM